MRMGIYESMGLNEEYHVQDGNLNSERWASTRQFMEIRQVQLYLLFLSFGTS